MNLSGKTALITGAGRGIGKGCAIELARAGADIVINDRPGSPDLEGAAADIRSTNVSCVALEADVFSREGCEQLITQVLQQVPQIDILVSNPAFSRRSAFLDCPPDLFEKTLAGTLAGGFHMSQLVARHMVEHEIRGKIVFISSVQAELPIANCVPYGAAKAGLNHMTRSIAVELAAHRINVNAIEPGWIDTPGEHATFGDDAIREEGAKLPWGRIGLPEDIGKAAAFLCSEAADYITGTVLPVDGLFRFKGWTPENTRQVQNAE